MYTTATVKQFCETKDLTWFLNFIVGHQTEEFKKAEEFQVWKLKAKKDGSAKITCGDGNGNTILSYSKPSLKLDDKKVIFWFENDTIYFPSER